MAMIEKSFWKDKRVFLTGHTGFKGTWLLQCLLKLGANVTGYSLLPNTSPSLFSEINPFIKNKYKSFIGDICNRESLKKALIDSKPNIIFHLAAQPLVRESYLKPIETWMVNVMGTLFTLEEIRNTLHNCTIVIVTTDKVYKNKEWGYGYRENDELGGYDPYSSSKASVELLVHSWRKSFCSNEFNCGIATARAGNVIGGGDWATDRLIPDIVRGLSKKEKIIIRSPHSTRPWQHVLEPIFGYLLLAENLFNNPKSFSDAFNFGPNQESNATVQDIAKEIFKIWQGDFTVEENSSKLHEANLLKLQIDKSYQYLSWKPLWDFKKTIYKTISWYQSYYEGISPFGLCESDIDEFYDLFLEKLK
ncbi:MAG: CDP-glucose 4,6-dehydratase [Prochlorococcus marinus XMU1422]|nr:CDP-glucose 4,6-dehydratase [Prochlorococcus marinus XMU1421]MBO7013264.1 CDP-glucose 4,6-dehydratase [Prochlorococcus marinus XMU1422]